MVTVVSGFIEQVGNMIKGIPKHMQLSSINPLAHNQLHFKELPQTLVSKCTCESS